MENHDGKFKDKYLQLRCEMRELVRREVLRIKEWVIANFVPKQELMRLKQEVAELRQELLQLKRQVRQRYEPSRN